MYYRVAHIYMHPTDKTCSTNHHIKAGLTAVRCTDTLGNS